MIPPHKLCRKHSSPSSAANAPRSRASVRSCNGPLAACVDWIHLQNGADEKYRRRSAKSPGPRGEVQDCPLGQHPEILRGAAGGSGVFAEEFASGENRAVIVFRA